MATLALPRRHRERAASAHSPARVNCSRTAALTAAAPVSPQVWRANASASLRLPSCDNIAASSLCTLLTKDGLKRHDWPSAFATAKRMRRSASAGRPLLVWVSAASMAARGSFG